MAKFYVQSGTVKMILEARDSRCAAIWAAHRKLNETLPFLGGEEPSNATNTNASGLAETMCVSQRGFDRKDATVFQTLDIVSEWSRLLVALDRLSARVQSFTVTKT
ncbi:MAG TPA: hypothetical protein VGI40_11480 [Pirellulaceae bacterium]|jgi:hypothetical protein